MKQNEKLKLFISYSHLDEEHIKEFIKHIAPLKSNGLIEDWYDRKTIAGQDFQDKIDNNLGNSDIVCLFISANFLSSKACVKEKKNSLELRKKKGIVVVPIILSACGWLDDKEISSLLALPEDGKQISDFTDPNNAWHNVYIGLKVVIETEIKIKQLKITEQFSSFLQNTGLLAKAHSQKEKVLLDDIFVYPELKKYDDLREYEKKESSEKLIEDFVDYSKILIAGENQSGKTTLCKKIFIELREKNFVPVYISDKTNQYKGKIENKIKQAYKEQYETIPIEEIDKQRIVPILDDFHFAKNKEKHIQDLSTYHHQMIVVDDIFNLNFKDENLINSFTHLKIKEYSPSLRNQLIKKWTHLTDKKNDINHNENEIYESIDNTTELVNTALGKVIGSGIMPAYPFFILSVISTYETFEKPLDQEITSQGYCYQALIYLYLRKQGVKNDEIDTYINFLTEFAFFFYTAKKNELSIDEFNSFMESYLDKYNFPIKQETLLSKLQQTQIIALDSCNNYSFYYQYLYYFFVAKYLAEHVEENKKIINFIINNLHKDENAYIAIFISHHSKNVYILDEIIPNAYSLFDKYKPATLSKEELSFFDEQVNIIVNAVLPPTNVTPEMERAKRLKTQDVVEQINRDKKKNIVREEDNDDDLAIELRRSIKTVEVMGRIIKNRAGSLEKSKLESIFEEAMKVHLRILTSFFELIKHEEGQQKIVEFISNRLNKIVEDKAEERKKEGRKEKKRSKEELEEISKTIFWNMNFFVIYGLIDKIIHSVGSNKLTAIIKKGCDNENTPASFLVKHGILMWYNKNIQIDNIAERIDEDGFSDTAKKLIRFMIVNHCSMHSLGFKEKQKIEHKLRIPSERLLILQAKRNEHE
ncbi:MAG: toll/interleukin-1 receptor domain-containing protein [Deltaproteobacteria bacterium]|nr:toll/interleukin-1 receptor domain-containing protein [Deltaproteobacteria bacterium]